MRYMEICCGSAADAFEAWAGGAPRVEFCSALEAGGLTPSPGAVLQTLGECPGMDVNVLIRPRKGDFVYSPREISVMEKDIAFFREAGVHGVVFGALTPEGDVDRETCARLLKAAKDGDNPLSCTFHRAFDVCREPFAALGDIVSLGFDTILTSGQASSAEAGISLLRDLIKAAAGRIVIMPGAGINPANISRIESLTGAREFHSSASLTEAPEPVITNPAVDFEENKPRRRTDRAIVAKLVGNQGDILSA
ncbi:MAG: copper homeostasis protein CutC [Bacteroidales bacterium]|nr:copper homeostasis protein CutC [Bacteroidales bacterium]